MCFLRAACRMDSEEMSAVIEVMRAKEKQKQSLKTAPEKSRQEDAKNVESSRVKRVKRKIFSCSVEGCDKEFHDKFLELDQAPKSSDELVQSYGYDIRQEDNAPRARRRRK